MVLKKFYFSSIHLYFTWTSLLSKSTDRILDPHRASRKFTEKPMFMEDPNVEIKKVKEERAKKLASLNEVDEIALEKIKAKRLQEQKLQEQK